MDSLAALRHGADVFLVASRGATEALQYGLFENVDVGVFIPIVDLDFRGKSKSTLIVKSPEGFTTLGGRTVKKVEDLRQSDFPPSSEFLPDGIRFDEQKTGVADIVLRTKVLFGSLGGVDFGALLNVALPTGDQDNLLGTGSTRVEPRLLISKSQPRFSLHVNAGPHLDTDDSDRSRFDYSAGGEVRMTEWLTLLLDQVGRVQVSGDEIKKLEIVPGVKIKVAGNLVVGFNAIVPLNREGLTTGFTPNVAGDFSYAF